VFPVLVQSADPAKPVALNLAVDYGVCKDICIPARAELAITLSGDGSHRAAVQAALDRVPQPAGLGAPGALSILAIAPVAGGKPAFAVQVRAPAGAVPALFAEGPDNWYLSTSRTMTQGSNGDGAFVVTVDERPKDAPDNVPVRLTLVAGGQAIETEIRLDAAALPR
jgi:DsbC/DsbD-like thiol-disulfide interchange protein